MSSPYPLKSHLHLLEIQNNYWENDDRIHFCVNSFLYTCVPSLVSWTFLLASLTKLYFHWEMFLTHCSLTAVSHRCRSHSSEAHHLPASHASFPAGQILIQLVIPYTCIFVFVLSPAALGLEKPRPKKAKACVQNMQLDGWLVRDSAKRPHSLFNIFPIVCLIYFRIWTLISILLMFLRVFGKRRRERVEENKHDLDSLDWKSCEGRQIPVPYCASSLWARSNASQTHICFPCLAFMY